jgi:hypothetical protein
VFCDPAGARDVVVSGEELREAVDQVIDLVGDERQDPSPIAPAVFAEP